MKIVVFGATGGTGARVVQQALDAGHEVTAAVRRPEAVRTDHPRLRKVRCDVFDEGATADAIAGQACVVSALGAVPPIGPTAVLSAGIRNIVAGAHQAGVCRIVAVSAAAIDASVPVPPHLRVLSTVVLRPLLFGLYVDTARMEGVLEASDCDWTVVRPPRLTNGRRTADYRMAIGRHLPRMTSVSRADLADCVLRLIPDAASRRTWVEVSGNAWF